MTSSELADGSWELTVLITDINIDKTLRVKGELHIGGLMLRLVEDLDVAMDWSDFGIWWPDKSVWLLRTHLTLDQYGVQADALLHFTLMHNNLRIQLPDLQMIDFKVNYSINVFSVVIKICKELGIRHPEELSLARKLEPEELKKNHGISATRRTRPAGLRNSTSSTGGHHLSNSSLLETNSIYMSSPRRFTPGRRTSGGTLMRTCSTPITPYGGGNRSPYSPCVFNANSNFTPGSVNSLFFGIGSMDSMLSNSPVLPTSEALRMLYRPKNLSENARINAGWLDSSRSLMEQGITVNTIVLLRFKFYNFYDLNHRYDQVRINQIYEQAKWSILSEELDYTQEEMLMFAALQLQIQIQSQNPETEINGSVIKDEDHIDAALNELQMALEGTTAPPSHGDITQVPELCDYLRFYKPKRFWFQSYKRYYFVFKETCLFMYRTSTEINQSPHWTVNLKGCEVASDILIASCKYNIKILIPTSDGQLSGVWLKADNEEQYARWMAAFRLACKGKTMADSSSFDSEVKSILSLLSMQHRPLSSSSSPSHFPLSSAPDINVQPQEFVAPRFLKKFRVKQLKRRIVEVHRGLQEMNLIDTKLTYIRAWQALPDSGITYFIIRFKGSKKEELMGIAFNQMVRMSLASGETLQTWRFQKMKSWSVNWEIKQVQVSFEEEDLAFQCLTADCKVLHEFIGGYIFLSMRSGNRNQILNEELFHKLTGGWI